MVLGCGSAHNIKWVKVGNEAPWEFDFAMYEIKSLCIFIDVEFHHILRVANAKG